MAIEQIPLALVRTSPMNPRKTFDEVSLEELSVSIEKQGLLQAILVRPIEYNDILVDGEIVSTPSLYEVVCGERRYRAMKILEAKDSAQYSTIDCNVKEMSDDDAFDAMITENLQRKDVDPIEEAFAFGQLAKKGKSTEEIATRFGKSTRFVTDRIKLNNLIPELLLAVKEDRMSISAAMLASKLEDEQQRKLIERYGSHDFNISKYQVESYVQSLFMTIGKAVWNASNFESDADYSGGCGVKCSECQYNTENHGCLFWEMKGNDSGRCTDRQRFHSKEMQFIRDMIAKHSDGLVRKGENYIKGKAVLFIDRYNSSGSNFIKLCDELESIVKENDHEYITDTDVFNGRCFYDNGDERIEEKLANGELYPVIKLTRWDEPNFQLEYYYVKSKSSDINCDENGLPYKVGRLMKELEREKTLSRESACVCAGADAICNKSVLDNSPLDALELDVVLMLMLNYSRKYQQELKLNDWNNEDEIAKYVHEHSEDKNRIIREWIRQSIDYGGDAIKHLLRNHIELLGERWCSEAYKESQVKANKKIDRNVAKIEKCIAGLGFTPDGKQIATEATAEGKSDVSKSKDKTKVAKKTRREQFDYMKAKHPDAVLLFRIGERYKAFQQDAATLGIILGLKVETVREDGKDLDVAWFNAPDLDTYLPKIIQTGTRVAICEDVKKD